MASVSRLATLTLSAITIAAWFFIAGWSDPVVTIYELATRGGAVRASEVWTLFTSQFVHVHRAHMFLNVAHLLLLGWWLEPRLRAWRLLAVYLGGGAAGQLAVVLMGGIATGASQSTAALAGAAVTMARTRFQVIATAVVIVMIAALDLWFAQTIKIGHVVGCLAGALISILLRSRAAR